MQPPISSFLSPATASEQIVLERLFLKLGQLNMALETAPQPLIAAIEGRGLIAAVCTMVSAAAQAGGSEGSIEPLDLYAALYGIALPGRQTWTLSARAKHLALRLDGALQPGHRDGPGGWLGGWLGRAPSLPADSAEQPSLRLFLALELLRLACLSSRRQVECWGALPFALAQVGLTARPIPALTLTHQRLRFERFDARLVRLQLLDRLDMQLAELLGLMVRLRQAQAAMAARLAPERKAQQLGNLAGLLLKLPLLSPALAAQLLGLDISTAGRLLTRATELELVRPLTDRDAWKVYAATQVADCYGLKIKPASPPRQPARRMGRPNLAEIDALLASLDEKAKASDDR
jgi:hypothetical protein